MRRDSKTPIRSLAVINFKDMKTELKIYTSFVSPLTLKMFTSKGLLPIFIIRNIGNSELIGKYSDTAVHFRDLAPSNETFREWRDKKITDEEYLKKYACEIGNIDLEQFLRDLEGLVEVSGAKGIVLLGYGQQSKRCHRSVLREILNNSGLLVNRVCEILV